MRLVNLGGEVNFSRFLGARQDFLELVARTSRDGAGLALRRHDDLGRLRQIDRVERAEDAVFVDRANGVPGILAKALRGVARRMALRRPGDAALPPWYEAAGRFATRPS